MSVQFPLESYEDVLIGVAWPYANSELHLGHYSGNLLPADVFARYQRMRGRNVLMVSGSDCHGTPITVTAEGEGVSPRVVVDRCHERALKGFQKVGITFDLYTDTMTKTHEEVVQDMFRKHLAAGTVYKELTKQLFDRMANRFLPDRYVEGTCPYCGFKDARGDQCDQCSKTYEATQLLQPKSKLSGSTDLEVRDTEHYFFDLGKTTPFLQKWLHDGCKKHWRPSVINFSQAQADKGELRGRPITRDMEWGIPVPVDGFATKRFYVWYEAVVGYLSASKAWSKRRGSDELWRRWWEEEHAASGKLRSYYFMGKDNITFHTIMWPSMLHSYGGLALPYDVPASDYLNVMGRKLSKSRGNAIPISYATEHYQVDAWRYVLVATAPETGDSDFTWDDFLERVNSELVATWGNLVNRVLSFAYKRFDGKIPTPSTLDERDKALLNSVREGCHQVEKLFEAVRLRGALEETRALSQQVNQYLSEKAPWTTIKSDPAAAATVIYVALQCIDWLSILWAPILPTSSSQIRRSLGYSDVEFGSFEESAFDDENGSHKVLEFKEADASSKMKWIFRELIPGQAMGELLAPYQKLDPLIVEKETSESASKS